MANIKKGSVFGDISGKVGTVVLTRWRGAGVVKSVPVTRKKPKTSEEQTKQKELFNTVMSFLINVRNDIFKIGYQLPKNGRMTPLNAATSYHMLHAVEGEYPDYCINLAKVKFSHPIRSTESGWKPEFVSSADYGATINWALNPFPDKAVQLDDEAIIIFYDKNTGLFLVKKGLRRDALSYTFPNRHKWYEGHEIFSWIFFISSDGKLVSETTYLGMIKLMP